MSYIIKALLISFVAGTPLSYESYGHSSSSASSSFHSSMSHSSGIASHDSKAGCGSSECHSVVVPSRCGSVGCSSEALSFRGLSQSHHSQRSSAVSLNTHAFQSKLIKYQGFSRVPHTLLTQISSLLLSQIQSRKIVYADILGLCSQYNYDITLINTGLFKFFQENYAHINYDLQAFYNNRIQAEGSSIVRRIASHFSGISVSMIQNVMTHYLDHTFRGEKEFDFAKFFSSLDINIQSVNVKSLQNMFEHERQNLIYSCPDIKIPSFIFRSSHSHSHSHSHPSHNQSEVKARSEFYSKLLNEFSQASFSSQSSYESFFSASRSKYSGCGVCLKEIDSLHTQAKTLSKSESSSVSIKQKLESSIKVESEFGSSIGVSSDSTKSSSDVSPSPVTPAAEGTDASTANGTDASTANGTDASTANGTDASTANGTDASTAKGTDASTTEGTDASSSRGTDAPTKKEEKSVDQVQTPTESVVAPSVIEANNLGELPKGSTDAPTKKAPETSADSIPTPQVVAAASNNSPIVNGNNQAPSTPVQPSPSDPAKDAANGAQVPKA